jgi:hypothetical protein
MLMNPVKLKEAYAGDISKIHAMHRRDVDSKFRNIKYPENLWLNE